MAYSWGQIEISRRIDKRKDKKKHGYNRKVRRALKNIDFIPANNGYKGYQ